MVLISELFRPILSYTLKHIIGQTDQPNSHLSPRSGAYDFVYDSTKFDRTTCYLKERTVKAVIPTCYHGRYLFACGNTLNYLLSFHFNDRWLLCVAIAVFVHLSLHFGNDFSFHQFLSLSLSRSSFLFFSFITAHRWQYCLYPWPEQFIEIKCCV